MDYIGAKSIIRPSICFYLQSLRFRALLFVSIKHKNLQNDCVFVTTSVADLSERTGECISKEVFH